MHSTPFILECYVKGYEQARERKLEESNSLAHLQGQYIVEALLSTVGNMFSGKSAKKFKYPDKPYELNTQRNKELTEEELQRQRELFVARLEAMKTNFELNHNKKGE